MAYPKSRSCTAELFTGMTDGVYKKVVTDRGGIVEVQDVRKDFSGLWHGINEIKEKCLPDGRYDRPVYYQDMAPEDMENV